MVSPNEAPPKAGRAEWAGLLVLSLATMMITFDMFVLLLALPALSADLRPTAVEQLWILDIYGFMVGGFLITMGTLGDRIGRRKLLMFGAASFAVALLVAAYATSPATLIAARALLGIAGATLAPSTLALISNMFRDAKQQGLAIGVWAGSFTFGAILGPIAGGFVLGYFWWGSVFLLGVPVMVLLLILGPLLLPEFKDPSAGSLDLASAGLSLGAMLAFIYSVKELARYGWDPIPVFVGLIGIGLGVMFARRQFRLPDPMLDLSMFRTRSFSTMLVGLLLYGIVGASSMLFITQFFQSVSGLTPFQAALALLPGMVVATISATMSPLLARRVRPAYLIGYGVLGVAAVFIWFSQVEAATTPAVLIIGFAVIGLCDGPLVSLGTNLVVSAAPPEKAGQSSSMSQIANEAGASLGVAVMGSLGAFVYTRQLDANLPAEVPAGAAGENVASAVAEASELSEPAGSVLLAVARSAFADGLSTFAIVSAAVLVLAAIVILTQLRHVPPTGQEEPAPTEDDTVPGADTATGNPAAGGGGETEGAGTQEPKVSGRQETHSG